MASLTILLSLFVPTFKTLRLHSPDPGLPDRDVYLPVLQQVPYFRCSNDDLIYPYHFYPRLWQNWSELTYTREDLKLNMVRTSLKRFGTKKFWTEKQKTLPQR